MKFSYQVFFFVLLWATSSIMAAAAGGFQHVSGSSVDHPMRRRSSNEGNMQLADILRNYSRQQIAQMIEGKRQSIKVLLAQHRQRQSLQSLSDLSNSPSATVAVAGRVGWTKAEAPKPEISGGSFTDTDGNTYEWTGSSGTCNLENESDLANACVDCCAGMSDQYNGGSSSCSANEGLPNNPGVYLSTAFDCTNRQSNDDTMDLMTTASALFQDQHQNDGFKSITYFVTNAAAVVVGYFVFTLNLVS